MGDDFPISASPPLSRQEVYYAFRFAFGRDPRPVDVEWHRQHPSFDAMRQKFIDTEEFRLERGMIPMPASGAVAVEMANGATIWLTLRDRYVATGILQGGWEPLETRYIASCLKPGAVFLDIGAFLGWFTLTAAPLVGPSGAVIAFEPQADAHALLRKSILANRFETWVSTHEAALSDKAGDITLWQDEPADGQTRANLGHTWLGMDQPANSRPAGKARSMRLDDLDLRRRIDVVKLDVEGAEWLVLEGGERTIRASHPTIVCEFFPEQLARVSAITGQDLIDRLASWGYRPHLIAPDLSLRPFTDADMPAAAGALTTLVFT